MEGLYRVSGAKSKIDQMKVLAEKGDPFEIHPNKILDCHAYCGLVKLFFKSLPQPIFPFHFFNSILSVWGNVLHFS